MPVRTLLVLSRLVEGPRLGFNFLSLSSPKMCFSSQSFNGDIYVGWFQYVDSVMKTLTEPCVRSLISLKCNTTHAQYYESFKTSCHQHDLVLIERTRTLGIAREIYTRKFLANRLFSKWTQELEGPQLFRRHRDVTVYKIHCTCTYT